MQPAGLLVPPGETAQVSVIGAPPAEGLAAWVVEIAYDPAVLTTTTDDCRAFAIPLDAFGVSECEAVDDDGDGTPERLKIFGAFVRQDGSGLTEQSSLADITFAGADVSVETCTTLTLSVTAYTDSAGAERGPQVLDGQVCVAPDAPPGGTEAPSQNTPRQVQLSGAAMVVTPGPGAGEPEQAGEQAGTGTGGADSGDGGSTLLIIIGAVVLVVVAVAAWMIARSTGRDGTSAG